ncbi:MAG: acetylxylan esterase [Planctomycetaceae bacterium]|nr:acetylxylan esterase [Planctomycetaceae bacterium]
MSRFLGAVLAVGLLVTLGLTSLASADAGRVYPDGETPKDKRLAPQKDLNGYFPFKAPKSLNEWEQRADQLRLRILVSSGLWPMPRKTPANAVIHSRFERDGITIDKVYLESYPGHFITGLLFKPKGKKGPFPGVLSPHGHGGRLQDHGPDRIRQYIVEGAERFEDCGRFPKISRCVGLARMGCVVFIYDMLGYADSTQISRHLAHGFAVQRPEMDKPDKWGFYSTQAELRMQSILGVQVYNSIRALDWLASLEDVDESRLAVTGGSGGGTQTILLGAIDPRPVASFPQGMVSTSMQGGCTCENATCLRIGTGNVELAGLFAPRPLAMTGANDWTREIGTKGYPQLQELYTVYGNVNNVYSKSLLHFGHNYNYVTRAIMYRWFNKHLELGHKEPIVEAHYKPLTSEELSIWSGHEKPEGGDKHELALTKYMDDESNHLLEQLTPKDFNSLAKYREVVGGAFETLLNRRLDDVGRIEREKVDKQVRGGYLEFKDKLFIVEHSEELPVVSLFPKSRDWNHEVVIWIDGDGKSGLYADNGDLRPEVRALVDGGTSVLTADLLYQGDFLKDDQPLIQTPKVKEKREFAGYTFGYNETVFAHRVHDILSLISFVANDEHGTEKIHLVGTNGGGALVAAARAQAGKTVHTAVVDTEGFRFTSLKSFRDVRFLPGAVKYGDIPGLLSLSAPHALVLAGEKGDVPAIVSATYKASGKQGAVRSTKGKLIEAVKQLIR